MNQGVMTRLTLGRHLYGLALQSLRIPSDVGLHSCVNLMQDAVEAFLIAVAEHVDAVIPSRPEFDKYFVCIDKVIEPKQLPLRIQLLRLNKIRVSSKHDAISPQKSDCQALAVTVRNFFEQVSSEYLGVDFWTATPIDLLTDGEAKDFLIQAKEAKENSNFYECILNCRKALYVEIEAEYDISQFRVDAPKEMGLLALFGPSSKAPYYAHSDAYISKYVYNATDFIVFDHDAIERSLLRNSVDPTMFWNVLKLTPPLWRSRTTKDWFVKRDLSLCTDRALAENVDYVLQSTIQIVFSIHSAKRAVKIPSTSRFRVILARANVAVFEKADSSSTVKGITPDGVDSAFADFDIEGIADGHRYWNISVFDDDNYLAGYVLESDLVFPSDE